MGKYSRGQELAWEVREGSYGDMEFKLDSKRESGEGRWVLGEKSGLRETARGKHARGGM